MLKKLLSSLQGESQEQVTNQEIKKWLQDHESRFTLALEGFGRKSGNRGFHMIRSSKGREYLFGDKKVPKFYKSHREGEFSGIGLCTIACGVLEEVIRNRYRNNVEVASYYLITHDMDINQDWDIQEKALFHHHNVRFRAAVEQEEYIVDTTYKQFNYKVRLDRMMIIAPQRAELHLYTYNQWYNEVALPNHPEEAWKALPQKRNPGELHQINLESIREGAFQNITESDYLALFDAFKD